MTNILKVREGKEALKEKEIKAAEFFKTSKQALDDGVLLLRQIRNEALWHYAIDEDGVMLGDYEKPHWEKYLGMFCDRHGISRSGVFDHLNIVDTWVALGISAETVADEHVGVVKAKYIRDMGVRLDGRTGELTLPPPEVIERLPGDPDDPPEVRIQKKIEEAYFNPEVSLRPADLKKSFSVDAGGEPEIDCFESGKGDIWMVWSHEDQHWDGVIIPEENFMAMPNGLQDVVVSKLKIRRYKEGG